jgi:hypothetical protein
VSQRQHVHKRQIVSRTERLALARLSTSLITFRAADSLPKAIFSELAALASDNTHLRNHVHALIEQIGGFPLGDVVPAWKSFTAKQANRSAEQVRSGRRIISIVTSR